MAYRQKFVPSLDHSLACQVDCQHLIALDKAERRYVVCRKSDKHEEGSFLWSGRAQNLIDLSLVESWSTHKIKTIAVRNYFVIIIIHNDAISLHWRPGVVGSINLLWLTTVIISNAAIKRTGIKLCTKVNPAAANSSKMRNSYMREEHCYQRPLRWLWSVCLSVVCHMRIHVCQKGIEVKITKFGTHYDDQEDSWCGTDFWPRTRMSKTKITRGYCISRPRSDR